MLVDVVGPCCHLRPRCHHDAYVTLGNAHKLRPLNWPKGGLLDVVFAVQFQKFFLAFFSFARSPATALACIYSVGLDEVCWQSWVELVGQNNLSHCYCSETTLDSV